MEKSDNELQHQYLTECFSKTYDELVARIQHRDNWLKIQLISQLSILALPLGVEIGGVKLTTSSALPIILTFAAPLSYVIAVFYLIEENLITRLTEYIANLSTIERDFFPGSVFIPNFDASIEANGFFEETQRLRLWGQIFAFVFIPLLSQIIYFSNGLTFLHLWWLLIVAVIILIVTCNLIILAHVRRKSAIERINAHRERTSTVAQKNTVVGGHPEPPVA